MHVEGQRVSSLLDMPATGARVRNAYPTCRVPGDSPLKGGLIPDVVELRHLFSIKDYIGTPMGMRMISLPAG